jgi:hypothetical protein
MIFFVFYWVNKGQKPTTINGCCVDSRRNIVNEKKRRKSISSQLSVWYRLEGIKENWSHSQTSKSPFRWADLILSCQFQQNFDGRVEKEKLKKCLKVTWIKEVAAKIVILNVSRKPLIFLKKFALDLDEKFR